MSRPTLKTIAKLSGFSIGTVSGALQNLPSVKSETRRKILEIARETGYVANLDGLKLKTGKSYRIAVLVSTAADAPEEWEGVEFTRILAGVSGALEGTRYQMAVHSAANMEDAMAELWRIVEQKLADGVIFSGTRPNDPRIEYLQKHDIPFVTYGMSDSDEPHAYVDIDSEAAAYDATARLAGLGHKRIALINPPAELKYAQQRQKGYSDALVEAGLEMDEDLVRSGPLSAKAGKEASLALSAIPGSPTAYVCANEALALGVLAGAHEKGLEVGSDLVVISMDDLHVSAYFSPPVSTYYMPIDETSRLLGQFMLRRLEGVPALHLQKKFRPVLIERQPDTA